MNPLNDPRRYLRQDNHCGRYTTYLPTYLPTSHLTYLRFYLPTILRTYHFTYYPTCLPA